MCSTSSHERSQNLNFNIFSIFVKHCSFISNSARNLIPALIAAMPFYQHYTKDFAVHALAVGCIEKKSETFVGEPASSRSQSGGRSGVRVGVDSYSSDPNPCTVRLQLVPTHVGQHLELFKVYLGVFYRTKLLLHGN